MGEHIILIGFMGAGKSTVARSLSRRLPSFRRTESGVLAGLAERRSPVIISTGGGLPMREENRRVLRQMGRVVYLRVKPETVCARLASDTTRPLLQGGDRKEKIRALLAERGPFYEAAAHFAVDTDGKRPDQIAEEILTALGMSGN